MPLSGYSLRAKILALICLVSLIALYLQSSVSSNLICSSVDSIVRSRLQQGIPVETFHSSLTAFTDIFEHIDVHTAALPNNHLTRLLTCAHKQNSLINAIRLQDPILKISLTPPNTPNKPELRYFNPTIIPLPPHSPFPYLLLSRLVTEGLHQESHICLATSCLPRNITHSITLSPDTRFCDESDIQILGPQGGIRCATAPERLNIPPTPAYRCEGAWAAFPDIPGFHDPRVFWSGKGEPLVIVNSGSHYACVGLWIVDLRAVYKELDELMERKGKYARTVLAARDGDGRDGRTQIWLQEATARMSYPYLTELTRSPSESRGSVEKNWILFFPVGDESWVQYDVVAHGERGRKSGVSDIVSDNPPTRHKEKGFFVVNGTMDNTTVPTHEWNETADLKEPLPHPDLSAMIFQLPGNHHANFTRHYRNDSTSHNQNKRLAKDRNGSEEILVPSRSIAKLIGSGYTTPNLTSPYETPCLSFADLLDNTGNHGHWHQGSNSLRLILCVRNDLSCHGNQNESELVASGKVVHFAVLHRKFSNDLDLPMRYERSFMVWESRFPFRMVGISHRPILFVGERAQPWSIADNAFENEEEANKWKDVYFTYTPSLAWAWRKGSIKEDEQSLQMGPGTGYLDDDVIVGVGMDDVAQGFARVRAEDLLSCLKLCPDFNGTE